MSAPFLTPISDTLYAPDGSLVTGTISIYNPQTFVSADDFTMLMGGNVTVPVINGVLWVSLVPNFGSFPTSTYTVKVQATDQYFEQSWSVPHSVSPVNLAEVVVS
jgi:hypothetical protein